jgi:hypothetical protein
MDAMSLNVFYYQQREWRIFSDVVAGERWKERRLSEIEKRLLCDSDDFFSDPIETTDPLTNTAKIVRRADLCRVLERVDGRPVCEFIRRVWVPSEALAPAAELLRQSDCSAELRLAN